jgi:predicted DNA-binding ribbon-helix-helix protein
MVKRENKMTTDDRQGNGSHLHAAMYKTSPGRDEPRGQGPAYGGYLRSRVLKRSIVVGRHRTSISLEDVFWNELREIPHRRGVHLSELVGHIDGERQHSYLSSAIRIFVFERARGRPEGGQGAQATRDSGTTALNRNR